MNEQLHQPSPERSRRPEAKRQAEQAPERVEQPKPVEQQPDLQELKQNIEQEAAPTEHLNWGEEDNSGNQSSSLLVKRELTQTKFWHTLNSARKRLSKPNRALSNVVHQPVVDAISNVSEKTIARPSGLLGGSLCAFIGSSVVLWMAKHYGFHYNFLLFFLLFVGGFGVGLVAELVLKLVRSQHQS